MIKSMLATNKIGDITYAVLVGQGPTHASDDMVKTTYKHARNMRSNDKQLKYSTTSIIRNNM